MDRYVLRREDYSLSEDQSDLQSAYQKFFKTNCSIELVRAAEATGFDKSLWERLCATGATTMALPESVGGDGATMVDLVLLAEEVGRSLAPVPWIDHVCAADSWPGWAPWTRATRSSPANRSSASMQRSTAWWGAG
jgi:alkylation response protein AidB-like acyl-CoA dehydrogenase